MTRQDMPEMLGNFAWADNWTMGVGVLHIQVMSGRRVWLAQAPCTREQFDRLELPEGFAKIGVGMAVADIAYFRRSPDAVADGPLETIEIGGIRFAYIAKLGRPEPARDGVSVLSVYKHHRVLYRAGRVLEILDAGDGFDYVPLAARARLMSESDADRLRILPAGWSIRKVVIRDDLLVELPCPTHAMLLTSGDAFQGPVPAWRVSPRVDSARSVK